MKLADDINYTIFLQEVTSTSEISRYLEAMSSIRNPRTRRAVVTEITGEWRILLNAELNALYFSSNINRNSKSRRLRCATSVARMEYAEMHRPTEFYWGNLKKRDLKEAET